ncbi:sulfite exporter TauE/SafE family protein [Candidatus Thiodiazotropha sp. CDECU1]|uniref:sulfite exporter TauE/SafE family protein n=1 Tax=Candidatus Thiodiazotropha sp. CDECU1 TaxID=3065865 RepID=UPI0029302249|nr:sulfite exporter TauE/SafE family protein [Candidatus Thiodiazotropha sp. CDECU1]
MTELAPLTWELIWLAAPIIFLAGLIHGTFGIGFPMIATPLLALFTDVFTAVLICVIPTMSVNLTTIWHGGREQLRNVRPYLMIIPFALIGTITGTFLLLWFDPRPFLLLLAAAVLLYLNQERLKRVEFSWVRRHPLPAYMLFGTAAGLMAGMVNVMLPVLIILFMELRIATATMVVLFNLNFFTGKLTQSLIFFLQEIPGIGSFLFSTLFLAPFALTALFIGMQLRKRFSAERYLSLLRGVLWLMAGILILRFFYAYT